MMIKTSLEVLTDIVFFSVLLLTVIFLLREVFGFLHLSRETGLLVVRLFLIGAPLSLVFSLVAPLDESGQSSFLSDSGPATGAYPTYPNCPFSFGYSASNMIGGTPNMTINSITGEITASPAIQGFFCIRSKSRRIQKRSQIR